MDALEKANPWWERGGEYQDPDLIRAAQEPLEYDPSPLTLDDLHYRHVYTLRGPRRAGKTVALKKLIAKAIQHGVPPRQLMWYAADTSRTLAQLEDQLRRAVARMAREGMNRGPWPPILMVDEITSVHEWQRVIKKLRDDGTLAPYCVILTGSSASDIHRGAERMPGRRRDLEHLADTRPLDRCLWPMDWREFRHQVERRLGHLSPEVLISHYLSTGGYPHRVGLWLRRMASRQTVTGDEGLEDLWDAVVSEFERRKLHRAIVLEIVARLAALGVQAVSWEAFVKPLQAASRDTVKRYLQWLGDAFLLAIVHHYDTARRRVALKRDRKLVWMDPALAHLAAWANVGERPSASVLAEQAVGAALIRQWEPALSEGVAFNRVVFTWKSASGKEVDYLVVPGFKQPPFPVEVKYQSSITSWDFQVMERAFGRGMLVTQSTHADRPKSLARPLADFLAQPSQISWTGVVRSP